MKSRLPTPQSRIRPGLRALALGFWLLLGAMSPAAACVGCREPGSETLAKESPTVLAGAAFSWSVLFMLVFVLSIVFGMSVYIWHTCRRIERERSAHQ